MVATTAAAEAASFDCREARTAIEHLICTDAELSRLDGLLGEAFAGRQQTLDDDGRAVLQAEQRSWSRRRFGECGIPLGAGEVPRALRWRAAPCLADLYRERLRVLEVAFEQAETVRLRDGEVHPLCVEPLLAVGEDADEAPVVRFAACNRGNRHVPVERREQGLLVARGAVAGETTWIGTRRIGVLSGDRDAYLVWYNGGGSGTFSFLLAVAREPDPVGADVLLTRGYLFVGGDRCHEGIRTGRVLGPEAVEIDVQTTAWGLLAALDVADDDLDGLESAAALCFGTIRYVVAVDRDESRMVSAEIGERRAAKPGEGAQGCLEALIRQRVAALPHTFPVEELKDLAADYRKNCRG
jgi:uncharacterized protein YecT (DUF1311 family)